jgi:osmotically-inducible protein OsmY
MQFSLASLPCLVAAPFCLAGCRVELAGIAAVSARQTFSRKSGLCQRHAEWDGPLLGDLMGASYVLKKDPKRGTPIAVGWPALAAQRDSMESDLQKVLHSSKYKNVQGSVEGQTGALRGTVEVFSLKEALDRKVHRLKSVKAVEDDVAVADGGISDQELQAKLVKGIEYDRVGYGTTPFNAISVNVQGGVATLGGHAYGPVDADSDCSSGGKYEGREGCCQRDPS